MATKIGFSLQIDDVYAALRALEHDVCRCHPDKAEENERKKEEKFAGTYAHGKQFCWCGKPRENDVIYMARNAIYEVSPNLYKSTDKQPWRPLPKTIARPAEIRHLEDQKLLDKPPAYFETKYERRGTFGNQLVAVKAERAPAQSVPPPVTLGTNPENLLNPISKPEVTNVAPEKPEGKYSIIPRAITDQGFERGATAADIAEFIHDNVSKAFNHLQEPEGDVSKYTDDTERWLFLCTVCFKQFRMLTEAKGYAKEECQPLQCHRCNVEEPYDEWHVVQCAACSKERNHKCKYCYTTLTRYTGEMHVSKVYLTDDNSATMFSKHSALEIIVKYVEQIMGAYLIERPYLTTSGRTGQFVRAFLISRINSLHPKRADPGPELVNKTWIKLVMQDLLELRPHWYNWMTYVSEFHIFGGTLQQANVHYPDHIAPDYATIMNDVWDSRVNTGNSKGLLEQVDAYHTFAASQHATPKAKARAASHRTFHSAARVEAEKTYILWERRTKAIRDLQNQELVKLRNDWVGANPEDQPALPDEANEFIADGKPIPLLLFQELMDQDMKMVIEGHMKGTCKCTEDQEREFDELRRLNPALQEDPPEWCQIFYKWKTLPVRQAARSFDDHAQMLERMQLESFNAVETYFSRVNENPKLLETIPKKTPERSDTPPPKKAKTEEADTSSSSAAAPAASTAESGAFSEINQMFKEDRKEHFECGYCQKLRNEVPWECITCTGGQTITDICHKCAPKGCVNCGSSLIECRKFKKRQDPRPEMRGTIGTAIGAAIPKAVELKQRDSSRSRPQSIPPRAPRSESTPARSRSRPRAQSASRTTNELKEKDFFANDTILNMEMNAAQITKMLESIRPEKFNDATVKTKGTRQLGILESTCCRNSR